MTTTLPYSRFDDVSRDMKWLVDIGPKTGLFPGGSKSIMPGVTWKNLEVLVEGLKYYRQNGS